MGNIATPPGSWGKIPAAKQGPDGRWTANGRYKTLDGKSLQRFRSGTTARKAETALLELFQNMAAEDLAQTEAAQRDQKKKKKLRKKKERGQKADRKFADAVEEWISYIEMGGKDLRASTAYEYARMARNDIVPSLGNLRLRKIDVEVCANFLHGIIKDGRYFAKAEHNRAVLSNILEWCAGRGMTPGNPVKQVASLPKPRKQPVQIIEKEDMATVLAAVRKFAEEKLQMKRPGPPPNMDIPDGVEMLLATGMRISELLALRWEDTWIDSMDDGSYWVEINGKVGWEQGRSMLRHDYGKTDDKILDLRISPEVAAMLRTRRANQKKFNPNHAIFPARGGSWMHQGNFRRRWREVRKELNISYDFPDDDEVRGRKQERRQSCAPDTITPHTFRRSVGTFIGETVSIDQAAQQLGHKRTAVTIRSYLRERQEAPDSSGYLANVMYRTDGPD